MVKSPAEQFKAHQAALAKTASGVGGGNPSGHKQGNMKGPAQTRPGTDNVTGSTSGSNGGPSQTKPGLTMTTGARTKDIRDNGKASRGFGIATKGGRY